MTEIIQTNPGRGDFYLFADFPKKIYPADSLRFKTPESIPEDFLESCYLLADQGAIVARASIYNNPLLEYKGQHALTVGNYECENNADYACKLLTHIKSEAKSFDAKYLIGPMNGSTWESYRFGVSDENPLFFTESCHHIYYNQHFLSAGFEPVASYFSNIDRSMKYDNPEILKREREFKDQHVTIRSIDLSHFEEEIERIYDFNTIAFKTNFLYTPINKDAFVKKYIQSKKYINPDFTLLAEDVNQNLIGYYFCVHDFFNINEKSLVVKTLARHPDPQWHGLGHVIGNVIYRRAVALGYTSAIHPFVYQQGTSTKLSANFSGVNYKNYILYGVKLAE